MITVGIWADERKFINEVIKAIGYDPNIKIDNSCFTPQVLVLQHNKGNICAQANILIMLDDDLPDNVYAKIAVSCGINEKNTITLSSAEDDCVMVSLQREILSVKGTVLEPREIDLSGINGTTEEKMLIGALKLVLEKDS